MADDQSTASWERYIPGETVLVFDAPVAVIKPDGRGRMTRTQHLSRGDRFQYLQGVNDG